MIDCRNANLAEVTQILDWAAAEGWNPGTSDAPAFFAADPEGFFVATENDTPVAAISVVNHNDTFAFLGLYIVRPDWRGKGIGLRLWTHALAHAGPRVVGLDGVPDQQENYRASGFAPVSSTTRFSGALTPQTHTAISAIAPDDIARLITLEAQASGSRKAPYLTEWFKNEPERTTIAEKNGGDLTGFCTLRQCRDGTKLGPFYAPDAGCATRLLGHAAAMATGPVIIDVPETAGGLTRLCTARGMQAGFVTARMYRGTPPQPTADTSFFAVTSLELG